MQMLFFVRESGHGESEEAALTILPLRLVEARAVPGDIGNRTTQHRFAIEEPVRGETGVTSAQRNQLARKPQHVAIRVN